MSTPAPNSYSSTSSNLIDNFDSIVSDVYFATHGGVFRPDYGNLLQRLLKLTTSKSDALIPRSYQTSVLRPFVAFLTNELKEKKFNELFKSKESTLTNEDAALRHTIKEVAEAILQRDHQGHYYSAAFRDLLALQALVTTIYDDIIRYQGGDLVEGKLAPLAKWGERKGPYTITADKTAKVNVNAGIVNLPAEHRTSGIAAWITLGHEIAGHNFLDSHPQLLKELQLNVRNAILDNSDKDQLSKELADYMVNCTEEMASDVLSVLDMGPAAAFGLIAYLKGKRSNRRLQNYGPFNKRASTSMEIFSTEDQSCKLYIRQVSQTFSLNSDRGFIGFLDGNNTNPVSYRVISSAKHPVDLLRPYAMSVIIHLLQGDQNDHQARISQIKFLVDKDFDDEFIYLHKSNSKSPSQIEECPIPKDRAIEAAQLAATAIARAPIPCLKNKCLMDIITWGETDENRVNCFRNEFKKEKSTPFPAQLKDSNFYARHIVAAAMLQSMERNSSIEKIFLQMKDYLVETYRAIPMWNVGSHTIFHVQPQLPDPITSQSLDEKLSSIFDNLDSLEQASVLSEKEVNDFFADILSLRTLLSLRAPDSETPTQDENLFAFLLQRAHALGTILPRRAVPAHGKIVSGTMNQFTIPDESRDQSRKSGYARSCTAHVVSFLNEVFCHSSTNSWKDGKNGIIDRILQQGKTLYIEVINRKKDTLIDMNDEAKLPEGVKLDQDDLHVLEIPDLEKKFSLKFQKTLHTGELTPDTSQTFTTINYFKNRLLPVLIKELSIIKTDSLGVVLQCNGSSYGLILTKIAQRPSQKIVLKIFDSHGCHALNKHAHGYIRYDLDIEGAAQILGNLIPFADYQLPPEIINNNETGLVADELNKISVVCFTFATKKK